ncbi:MAG: hypothetical protein K2N23_02500 [Clostridia bacterium]|nr:hypothetical protein [Clostridia bacterium]
MLNTEELNVLKKNTYSTILNATKFMIHHGMDQNGTKVRSTSPNLEKYGIWPTTEFLEFLLSNDALPITPEIVNIIEGMVEFIIEKYNPKEKKWPLTDVKGSTASAITSGHCIYVLKLYISRPFVDYTKTESIKQIIREAEDTLIADCRQDGSWKILKGDDAPDIGLNFGRFFYTYNAWFGIKKVPEYTDDLSALPAIRKRLAEYVIGISDMLLRECNDDKLKTKGSMLSTLICNMAKAIQILNDYDDSNCIEKKTELCNTILQMINDNDLNSLLYSAPSVEISELPNSGYNKFSNNIPFDLFFAIKDNPDCSELARDIINWYLTDINTQFNCWFFPGTNMNTWPTCEALLVLSNAHAFFFGTAIKQNCDNELVRVKEKYKECDGCKEKITSYLKPQKEQFKKSMDDYVRKVRKTSGFSIAVTIFACICAIAALIALSIILEQYWLNTLITVVIVPLILQIIFVIKIPESSDKTQGVQDDILKTIDESKDMWESEQ